MEKNNNSLKFEKNATSLKFKYTVSENLPEINETNESKKFEEEEKFEKINHYIINNEEFVSNENIFKDEFANRMTYQDEDTEMSDSSLSVEEPLKKIYESDSLKYVRKFFFFNSKKNYHKIISFKY